ncbi:MAG: formylglycine-generating enzyme family protein, partial [Bacteroidaceae bacterium]|nr:formylglycine-generating enzyme family protein [Bacteroidaceae bacterium]
MNVFPEGVGDASVERQAVEAMAGKLKDASYYNDVICQIAREKDVTVLVRRYRELSDELQLVCGLQSELEWLNVKAVRLAFDDMKASKGFDETACQARMARLETLAKAGFNGIYKGDIKAIRNAEEAIACKRAILLANPLLDSDRIVAARYRVGSHARSIMTPSLGTQANNWSNQESAARSGFDAEIVELSNLRGDVRMRSVYKPKNGSSISDLRMHWDADRVMFTQTKEDKRWGVFEVKLDGSGFHSLLEN